MYRLRCNYTYSSSTLAATAVSNINGVLAGWTSPVTAARATQAGSSIELKVVGLTEAQGKALHAALLSHVMSGSRTGGKFSLVRTPDVS